MYIPYTTFRPYFPPLLRHFIRAGHQFPLAIQTTGRVVTSSMTSLPIIKRSRPFSYHWITQGMFSILLTKLTMNSSWFHVLANKKPDYRLHFTSGGLLNFLNYYKHIIRCVNAYWMSKKWHSYCLLANETCFVDIPPLVVVKFLDELEEQKSLSKFNRSLSRITPTIFPP